jgi:tryptophan 2,3-dioxygenase
MFAADPRAHELLADLLARPSLYDEFLRHLARRGLPVPDEVLHRDVREPHSFTPELVAAFRPVYTDPHTWWDVYEACEELVDLEENFQLWRFRHLKTVERMIGSRSGTGGSSGAEFLRRVLAHSFFPELYAVRSDLG